jgi:hypothetical protein
MKTNLETLNLITGFILVAIGVIYLIKMDIPSTANWVIFGSMYLVVDDYKNKVLFDSFSNKIKVVFAWVGLIASILFMFYVLVFQITY